MGAKSKVSAFIYIAQYIGEQACVNGFRKDKYKVGWSQNIRTRIDTLTAGKSFQLKYVKIFYFYQDAFQIELDIKRLFVGYESKGKMNPKVLGESFWAFPEQIEVLTAWLPKLGGVPMSYKQAIKLCPLYDLQPESEE